MSTINRVKLMGVVLLAFIAVMLFTAFGFTNKKQLVLYDQVQIFDTIIDGRIIAKNIGHPMPVNKNRGDTIHYMFFKWEK